MSSLQEITEAMCKAVARNDLAFASSLARQAAAKMGGPRAERIERAFQSARPIHATNLKHWRPVAESRVPWTPASVAAGIEQWIAEVSNAQLLIDAGERVLPLLLSGETRCGKTSSLVGLTKRLGIQVFRLSIASAVGSHVGDTTKLVEEAFREIQGGQNIWLIDEIDAVAGKRGSGTAAADKELNTGLGSLLTEIESISPDTMLVATTNLSKNIDPAVRGRFAEVEFTPWKDLTVSEREAFAASHGGELAHTGESYAETVKACRRVRVDAILAKAGSRNAEAAE